MKTILQTFTIVCVLMCLVSAVSVAQIMTQEVRDAAQKQFEAAYEAELGEPPLPAATEQAMRQFAATVNGLAKRQGARAGKEAKMRQSLKKLDGPALISAINEIRVSHLGELELDKWRIAELTEPDMEVEQFDGRLLVENPQAILNVKENTEITFPAGNYALDEQKLTMALRKAGREFPKGIAFLGAGKNKTTLKITDARFTDSDVDRLSFRDMTIDCDNDGMFDKRRGSLTLQLARVKLIRFDAGHGGCKSFSINDGIIIHATDCDFVGGLGKSPGNGSIFDSTDVTLGHFERCSFTGINCELFRSIHGRSSILWMDDCQFDREYRINEGVKLKDCEFNFKTPVPLGAKGRRPQRKIQQSFVSG